MSVGNMSDRAKQVALWGIALAVSLIVMDATIVNVALPVVIDELHLTASDAQWMTAVYSLVFAALLLTVGRVGDLYGRRMVLGLGMTVFMLSSVVAGSAGGAATLIGARLVQGVGAAMILPTTLSTINTLFTGTARGRAFAVYGATIGGMAALGPLVGGWLTTDVSWRWAFWLNIPFGLLVLLAVATVIPETRELEAGTPRGMRALDLRGGLLIAAAMGGLVFALLEGSYFGWWQRLSTDDAPAAGISPVPLVGLLSVLALVAFTVVERSRARAGLAVLVDLRLLRLTTLRNGSIAALLVAFGEFGLLFALPLVLEGALGLDALHTGWVIVALAMGTFMLSAVVPHLVTRVGERLVVQAGLVVEALSVGALAWLLRVDSPMWLVAGLLFGYGAGVGLASTQLTSLIMSQVPARQSGQGSGIQSTVRQLGSALGVAVLGSVLVTALGHQVTDRLSQAGITGPVAAQVAGIVRGSVGAVIPSLGQNPAWAAAVAPASEALVQATRVTTGLAAGLLALALLATTTLPRRVAEAPGHSASVKGPAQDLGASAKAVAGSSALG